MCRCEFKVELIGNSPKIEYTHAERIQDLKDGFWVDEAFNFTRASNCFYWIPPSAIRIIIKEDD